EEITAPVVRIGNAQAGAAPGQLDEILRQQLNDEHEGDGDDDEGRSTGAQGDPTDPYREDCGERAGHRYQQEWRVARRDIEVDHEQAEGIGADTEERRVTKRS